MKKLYPVLLYLILTCLKVHAQENNPVSALNSIRVNTVSKDYDHLTTTIDRQSARLIKQMKLKEERLRRALAAKDSTKAEQLFSNSAASYQQLQNKLNAPLDKTIKDPLKEYLPSLDSLSTATQFLQKVPGVSPDKLQQLNQLNDRLQMLQAKMQAADEIRTFIKEREALLKEQLAQYGLGKQLLGINKTAYYCSQQVASYKELINDRKKMEAKLINAVREIPAFKAFWQKSSILSRLFPLPDNYNTPLALAGLQTTAQISSLVQQRIGSPLPTAGGVGGGIPQQYVEQAQAQLSQLKDKLVNSPLGAGGIMPDFKPNSLRTKRFLQRLEYGFNMQTSGATNFLPVTAELAALIGFKWNKNFSTGVGLSYKIGLGRGWNHIALSNQGAGARSYIDAKIKGNWWISGGMEYQYMKAFESLNEIKDINKWQRSTLMGLTRKYSIGKKKEGRLQVLYDFEAERQKPAGQPWKFRIGYSL